MKNIILLLITLITISTSLKTKMTKKIQKSKLSKAQYANEITVESVSFQDNCYALQKDYSFTLEISQTSPNYPLILNKVIYIVQESDSSNSLPCTCVGTKGTNTLNCTLDEDLPSSNYNNEEFRVQSIQDTSFSCTASGSEESENCLIKAFNIDTSVTYHNLYDVLSSEQNHTYTIDYSTKKEGEIYVKFDTFVMGEGPIINLGDDEIKKCEEIAYSDNEDEGEFIKCTVTESQFPVDNYVTHNVVVKNQCGYEEYPGITVVLLDSSNFGNWIKVGFGLALLFVLF